MLFGFGVDVRYDEHIFVLVKLLRRDFALSDLTENAVVHNTSPFSPSPNGEVIFTFRILPVGAAA